MQRYLKIKEGMKEGY